MIIHPIEKTNRTDGSCRLQSRIEWLQADSSAPEKLWYSLPAQYADETSNIADAFFVSLLPAAMRAGEDVHIAGAVSSRLLYAQREYQRVLNFWLPGEFSVVAVTSDSVSRSTTLQEQRGALSSFSGGIDSAYTTFMHLSRQETDPEHQLTHALFIQGFDTNEDAQTHAIKKKSFEQILSPEGITLIPVETNVRAFYADAPIAYCYHAIICGAALLFAGRIPRFYFSDDHTYDFPIPFSLSRYLTSHLSTEGMRMTNYGGAATKLEKIRTLTKWPEMHDRLVVCHENPNGLQNCGRCTKCCLTMTTLSMEGVLEDFTTFPARIDHNAVRRGRFVRRHFCFPKQWIAFGWSRGRYDIVGDYAWVLVMSALAQVREQHIPAWFTLDPRTYLYRLSHALKHRSPRYARLVAALKGSPDGSQTV